jgi:hypothetical protein
VQFLMPSWRQKVNEAASSRITNLGPGVAISYQTSMAVLALSAGQFQAVPLGQPFRCLS